MSSFRSGRSVGKAVLSTLLLSALAACGGGGGDSSGGSNTGGNGNGGPPNPPTPTMSRLTLTGTVTDAPIAGALVTTTIGGQTFTATADANGNYRIELSIEESATGAFITLTAKGVGSQSYVEFTSLLGTFAALRTQAGSDEVLSNTENFATQITNVSTALAALLQQANGGQPVNTQTLLDTLSVTLNGQQVLDLAATIKLLVDEADEYPMPSGQTSLQTLLADSTLRDQLVADFYEQDPTTFKNTQTAIVTDTTLTPPVTTATLPSALKAASLTDDVISTYADPNRAISYTFNTDGTGTATTGTWHRNTTWAISGSGVEITYAEPVNDQLAWERKICPELEGDYGYAQYAVYYGVTGAKLALLNARVLATSETRNIASRDCGTGADTEVVTTARTILDAEDVQTIDIADLRDSTRTLWVYDADNEYDDGSVSLIPDVAELHANGTGATLTYGKQFTWSLDASSRAINVTFDDNVTATFRSIRDIDDVATDVLYEFTLPTGRRIDAGPSLQMDPEQPAYTFNNAIGRHYRFGIDDQPLAPGAKGTRWRFDADGSGTRESERINQDGSVLVRDSSNTPNFGYRWYTEINDLIQQYTRDNFGEYGCDLAEPLCYVSKDLRIVPLASNGTRTYVLESWRFGQSDVSQSFTRYNQLTYAEYEPFNAPAGVNGKTSPVRTKAVRRDAHIARGADRELHD
jgi:hypothetical protein